MGQAKYTGLTVLNKLQHREFNGKVLLHKDALPPMLELEAKSAAFHKKHGRRRRVFLNSMSDLFHRDVPFSFIDKCMAYIALCPHVIVQILTKRAPRMEEYFSMPDTFDRVMLEGAKISRNDCFGLSREARNFWPLQNLTLGVSVESPKYLFRIDHLCRTPAAVRMLSLEPLLEGLDLRPHLWRKCSKCDGIGVGPNGAVCACAIFGRNPGYMRCDEIHWIVVGGESGSQPRDYDLAWPRSIKKQAFDADVPFFHKQVGARPIESTLSLPGIEPQKIRLKFNDRKGEDMSEWPTDLQIRQLPPSYSGPI